ncbi:MAG: ABC transporter permease [Treponema sp.]
MDYLYVELKKQKTSKIIMISFAFIAMSVFIGTGLFVANKAIMDKENYPLLLWGQSAFYYSNLLAPILAGIISSIIFIVDVDKKNFRRLKTSGVSLGKTIISKMLVMLIYSFIIQVVFLMIFMASSIIANVKITVEEIILFLQWSTYGALGLCTIMSITMFFYTLTKSFTGAVGLTVVGTFISFILLFISEGLSKYFPYSFIVTGMRSRILANMSLSEILSFLIINMMCIITFCTLSIFKIKKFIE